MIFVIVCAGFAQLPLVVEPEEITAKIHGRTIQVDGVLTGVVGEGNARRLRLRHCRASFHPHGKELPEPLEGNVLIEGLVRVEQKDVIVLIQKLELLPNDARRYRDRVVELRGEDPEPWYKLSNWAEDRGKKYEQPEMLGLAEEALRRAVEFDRKRWAGNARRLTELSGNLRRRQGFEYDWNEFDHEILRAEAKGVLEEPTALLTFANRIRQTLALPPPEARTVESDNLQKYIGSPIAEFRKADTTTRNSLARYWETTFLIRRFELLGKAANANPRELARTAKKDLPDAPQVAASFYRRWVEELLPTVAKYSRPELLELVSTVEQESGDIQAGVLLRQEWLKKRERHLQDTEFEARQKAAFAKQPLPGGDARLRRELAGYWREWFPHDSLAKKNAIRLLQDAKHIQADPEIDNQLRELGEKDGSANGTAAADSSTTITTTAPVRQRPTNRPIDMGMFSAEVVNLWGRPDTRARIVTKKGVVHQWTYHGISSATRIWLEPVGERLRVVKVHTHNQ